MISGKQAGHDPTQHGFAMMPRVLFIVFLLMGLYSPLLAEKIIYRHDDLGGKIEETVYEEGDNEYRYEKKRIYYDEGGYKIKDERFLLANDYNDLGVEKAVKTFSRNGRLKSVDVVFRYEKAMAAGYERVVLAYDETGTRRRMDVHFKDDHRDKRIYSKAVSYYDLSGVLNRTIYFFTEKMNRTTGYYRIIEQYDRKGRKIGETIYDRDGNEF